MAQPRSPDADQRGQYDKGGVGGLLILFGVTVGIYALSPGARHWYKHGRLPPHCGDLRDAARGARSR